MKRHGVTRPRRALPGALALLLVACATPPTREPEAPPPVPAAASLPAAPVQPPPAPPVGENRDSPWPRLRQSFAMRGCDYRTEVQRRARAYAQNPRAFTASWRRAMPFLLLVVAELRKRDLPGEFAMLPYLESGYRPLVTHGDRSAGMWQLVPDTAREAGVEIDADYDGRLDALASTSAALDLIARYYREFADWRLADMAFNSGEFRVRKLLGERDARSLSADELGRFAFNPVTHDHLDRLLALACIIDDPARFGIHLPEPRADDHLQEIALETGMDLRLAARLAGIGVGDVKTWNAGYRHDRMAGTAVHRLLLPAAQVERFRAGADAVPRTLWRDWHEQPAARTSSIGSWAAQLGVPVAVLALANALDEKATVMSSTRLLLPGREPQPTDASHASSSASARVHTIVAGNALVGVARRHSVPLRRLRKLDPVASVPQHPGAKLRVGAD